MRFRLPAPAQIPATADAGHYGNDGFSLPFRNDAAIVLRRLMRSLPTGKGVSASRRATRAYPP